MTIWNPLKNFGGAPPNAREWPSSRATQEAKLRGAARRRDGVGVLTNLRAKAWRHAVKFQRSDIGTPPPIGLEPHRLLGLIPESLSRCFRPASTRGDVGIAQDVDFNLQTVQAILDYINVPKVNRRWAKRVLMMFPLLFEPEVRHASDIERYSITSSARASSDGGTVRPSMRAVCALMTSSNFVGCITGKSVGLAPLRIRPI